MESSGPSGAKTKNRTRRETKKVADAKNDCRQSTDNSDDQEDSDSSNEDSPMEIPAKKSFKRDNKNRYDTRIFFHRAFVDSRVVSVMTSSRDTANFPVTKWQSTKREIDDGKFNFMFFSPMEMSSKRPISTQRHVKKQVSCTKRECMCTKPKQFSLRLLSGCSLDVAH